MILLKNKQKKIDIDTQKLIDQAAHITALCGYADFDLGIWLTTNATIKKYNAMYRDKNKATDVLSFPYHTDLRAGQKIAVVTDDDKNLGDLIISLEYVQKDAPARWGQTLEERLPILLVHGICHLLGYDHIEDEDYKIMKKKEDYLLKKLSA